MRGLQDRVRRDVRDKGSSREVATIALLTEPLCPDVSVVNLMYWGFQFSPTNNSPIIQFETPKTMIERTWDSYDL